MVQQVRVEVYALLHHVHNEQHFHVGKLTNANMQLARQCVQHDLPPFFDAVKLLLNIFKVIELVAYVLRVEEL